MTTSIPVRELKHLSFTAPSDDCWTEGVEWIPVSTSELHLACRYLPLAIRIDECGPRLGLLVHSRYLSRPPLDPSGKWRVAYRPIAIRSYPFEAPDIGDDPLTDIRISPTSKFLSPSSGMAIADDKGQPTRFFTELHRLFGLLRRSEQAFAPVLDHYLIADLLMPLIGEAAVENASQFYAVNPTRFTQMPNAALGAMARHNFLSVDVAIACVYSLQTLNARYLPRNIDGISKFISARTSLVLDSLSLHDLPFAVDDGELIPFNLIGAGAEPHMGPDPQ
jgi:hypothetical protein